MVHAMLRSTFVAVLTAAVMLLVVPPSSVQAAGQTKLTWYGHASFRVDTPNGGVILIDPWLSNPKNPDKEAVQKLERVDYILVTHGHGDHVGDSVQIAKATGAKLVGTAGLGRNMVSVLGYPEKQATLATLGNTGGTIELTGTGARVTIVNAVHGSEISVPDGVNLPAAVVTGGNPTGMVLRIDGGPTIYHTGDTDVFPGMELIGRMYNVDVMLASIGDHFTMGPHRAAYAAGLVQPGEIVPMHYGTFGLLTGTPEALRQEIRKQGLDVPVTTMQPGQTREL